MTSTRTDIITISAAKLNVGDTILVGTGAYIREGVVTNIVHETRISGGMLISVYTDLSSMMAFQSGWDPTHVRVGLVVA